MEHEPTVTPGAHQHCLATPTDLACSGIQANCAAQRVAFEAYHRTLAESTKHRQHGDLQVFCAYLQGLQVQRTPAELFHAPEAWRGITHGHLLGFLEWQRQQGFAIGSINVRLSTVRTYCALACQAGTIPVTTFTQIQMVKGYRHRVGLHLDEERAKEGLPTRRGAKKADPTPISRQQLQQLKVTTIDGASRSRPRVHDACLDARDTLLVHLLADHGLRCSEVVALNIEHFNLETQEMQITRAKTAVVCSYPLVPSTFEALCAYLATQERQSGPLFVGYGGQRITARALNARLHILGRAVDRQLEHLSPHDLRHRWAFDVIQAGNPLPVVQHFGGWKSSAMPLHYASKAGVWHGPLHLPD